MNIYGNVFVEVKTRICGPAKPFLRFFLMAVTNAQWRSYGE